MQCQNKRTLRSVGGAIETATKSMVLSTVVENGKTVRTWQQDLGRKTLTRKFYLKYKVNAICNGKYYVIAEKDTINEAEATLFDTKKKVDAKYSPKEWLNMSSRTALTHMVHVGFWRTFGAKKSIQLYITEESTGKVLSEVIE